MPRRAPRRRRVAPTLQADGHPFFFDIWSRFYDRTPFLRWALWLLQDEAIDLLAPRPGERVLDLGCGPARGTAKLLARGARAVGADYAQGMAVAARKTLGRKAPVLRLDALRLPFQDASFDGLLCTNSFHHYPDPGACLVEMRRVLRPGGRLVLVDPVGQGLAGWLLIHVGERRLLGLDGVHLHTEAEWLELLRAAGFRQATARRGSALSLIRYSEVFVQAVA